MVVFTLYINITSMSIINVINNILLPTFGWNFVKDGGVQVGHFHHHHQHCQCQQHHHLDHLVDKHAGEDGDKDADNRETEHCAKTRVDRPVDHLAV